MTVREDLPRSWCIAVLLGATVAGCGPSPPRPVGESAPAAKTAATAQASAAKSSDAPGAAPATNASLDHGTSWTSLIQRAPACRGAPATGTWCFDPAGRKIVDEARRHVTESAPQGGASLDQLQAVARRFERPVPADLAALLRLTNGGTLQGASSVLQLFDSESIVDPAQYDPAEWVPQGVAIGTDNGGSVYVYGTDGVYLVDMGAPDEPRKLALSLLTVAQRVARGDDPHTW